MIAPSVPALALSRAEVALLAAGVAPQPLLRHDQLELSAEAWEAVGDSLLARGILQPADDGVGISPALQPLLGVAFLGARAVTVFTGQLGNCREACWVDAGKVAVRDVIVEGGVHCLAPCSPELVAAEAVDTLSLAEPSWSPYDAGLSWDLPLGEYQAAVTARDATDAAAELPGELLGLAQAIHGDGAIRTVDIVWRVDSEGTTAMRLLSLYEGPEALWIVDDLIGSETVTVSVHGAASAAAFVTERIAG